MAKPLGGVNASILFSHFFYWHDKTRHELGIYRTAEEIEIETGLSVQEQRTARNKLKERGVLTETEKRIEHRIYYELNLDAFDDLMLQHSGSEESTAVIRTEDLTEDLTVSTPLSVFIVVCNQGLLSNDRINFYDDTIKNIKRI